MVNGVTPSQQANLDELEWDPNLDASKIVVEAIRGLAALAGDATTFAKELSCEPVARLGRGVRTSAIEVKAFSVSEHNNTDIASVAIYALKWNTWLTAERRQIAAASCQRFQRLENLELSCDRF